MPVIKIILKTGSILGLGLVVLPVFFVLADMISADVNKHLMLIGTVLWFSTAPFLEKGPKDI